MSIERLITAIDDGKPLKRNFRELEMSVKAVPGTIGDIIGFEKTDELFKILKQTFNEENFQKIATLSEEELTKHKIDLKEASEKYIYLWDTMES